MNKIILKIAEFFLKRSTIKEDRQAICGDLGYMYRLYQKEKGVIYAFFWCLSQLVISIPPVFYYSFNRSFTMFKNYLKITIRNLKKYKGYSFINVFGLAVGMACCILILLWVYDEITTDKFHENDKYLYKVCSRVLISGEWQTWGGAPPALSPALKEEFPEIVNTARLNGIADEILVSYKEKKFIESVQAGDFSLLEMFTFPLIKGSLEKAKNDLYSIFITENIAKKYFGDEDPIGKVFVLDNKLNFTVAGVLKKIPDNSLIKFDFLIPSKNLDYIYGREGYTQTWYNFSFRTFIQIGNNVSIEDLNKKIEDRITEGNNNREQAKPLLTKFSDIYLYGIRATGWNIDQVYLFGIIAGIVLLIACINFMNISTARAGTRVREIGMRKVVGAHRKNIIRQFFGESTVLTIISFFIAILLSYLFLPAFNNLSGKNLSLTILRQPFFIFGIIGIVFFTGLFSGSYPALFLASFRPVSVLKGSEISGRKGSSFRKILVVLQFVISIVLIVCTLVIYRQLNFIFKKDLGFDKEQIVYTVPRGDTGQKYTVMKQELLKNPGISGITCTQAPVSYLGWNDHNWDWEGKDKQTDPLVNFIYTDTDFLNTFSMEMEDGEFFKKEHITSQTEESDKVIINKAFSDIIGDESSVGKTLTNWNESFKIIGVIKDFHYQPLYRDIEPLVIFHNPSMANYIYIRINSQNISSTMSNIEKIFKRFAPDYPFEYRFLDQDFERLYMNVRSRGQLFRYFTILAIFISCLGLFGLASFIAERKTKEIGIRKTLGASISSIIILLNRDFFRWIIIANIIAWPLAFYLGGKLLENFAYRISLGLDLFIFSGMISVVISLLTVSFQAVKAAYTNPVKSLRNE